jgi:hypothetical protein
MAHDQRVIDRAATAKDFEFPIDRQIGPGEVDLLPGDELLANRALEGCAIESHFKTPQSHKIMSVK